MMLSQTWKGFLKKCCQPTEKYGLYSLYCQFGENLKFVLFCIRYWGRIRAEEYPLGIKIHGEEMTKKEKAIERWILKMNHSF